MQTSEKLFWCALCLFAWAICSFMIGKQTMSCLLSFVALIFCGFGAAIAMTENDKDQ